MTALPLRVPPLPRVLEPAPWLRLLLLWRAVHLLATLAAGATTIAAGTQTGLARATVLVVIGSVAVLDAASLGGLLQQRSVGRSLSLAVDYLTASGCIVVLLQVNRVFVGLDALGDSFPRGAPVLLVALAAYVGTGYGDGTGRSRQVRRVARYAGLVAMAAFLVVVGLLPGLLTFLGRTARPLPLALVALAAASGYLAWRTFQSDVAAHLGATERTRRTLDGLLFASPNLLGFAAFFAGPLLFSLVVSLTQWDAFGSPEFVGLGNYVQILALDVGIVPDGGAVTDALRDGYAQLFRFGDLVVGARDVLFWRSLRNIVLFAALALPLSVAPALLLASLLNSRAPGIRVFRAIYFIPSIAGVVAVALIWRQLFDATVGWINYLIERGIAAWNALPLLPELADPRLQWLSDADIALFSLVIVFAWQYLGYNAVLFLAGLQGVDPVLHEAAVLDGATRWQRFRHITLPALRPTTFFVVASTGILTLQLFGENVVLFPRTTPPGAGPQNATLTPVVYLYEQGFRRFAFGYASAVAWVLFLLIFAFTFLQFRRQREEVGT